MAFWNAPPRCVDRFVQRRATELPEVVGQVVRAVRAVRAEEQGQDPGTKASVDAPRSGVLRAGGLEQAGRRRANTLGVFGG